jgi:diketogulonate reductase-like aldo/keto reductase
LNPYVYKASRDLIEYCKSNGVAIEAYAPLGSIIYKPGGPVDEVVEKLGKKYNRSASQILLKWNLIKGLWFVCFFIKLIIYYLGDIIVTTSSKRERLEDFLKVLDENFQLSDEDIQAIDEAGAKLHFRKYWAKEIDGNKQEL